MLITVNKKQKSISFYHLICKSKKNCLLTIKTTFTEVVLIEFSLNQFIYLT